MSIQFLATEGMRTYVRENKHSQGNFAIMATIRAQMKHLSNDPNFGYQYERAEILHGHHEALGSWVETNLRCTKENNLRIGIIEMGGASMQLKATFEQASCFPNFGTNAGMKIIRREFIKQMSSGKQVVLDLTQPKQSILSDGDMESIANGYAVFDYKNEEILKKLIDKHIFTEQNKADLNAAAPPSLSDSTPVNRS